MNNHILSQINGTEANSLHNTFVIDVSRIAETVEPISYLVTLQQMDGNTQTLQLTEDEIEALGLKTYFLNTNDSGRNFICDAEQLKNSPIGQSALMEKPLGSSENPIQIIQDGNTLSTTQNVSKNDLELIANALLTKPSIPENSVCVQENGATNFIYRVVYPEELNLKPVLSKPEKRGRPKKRAVVEKIEEKVQQAAEETPAKKSARTRSGRITRPPRHIEKDFKKIDISEQDESEDVLTTTEFTPLTTSHTNTEEPKLFEPLSNSPKKRNISGKYRCPKCQKAYLGRSRMLKHLEDNPDHGPIPEHCKTNNSEVWNYLVDITQKCPTGRKGLKFCEELSTLLQNLKALARFLFKISNDKNTVVVDTFLGAALDLAPGNYRFNENELHKDVTIFKMLNDMKLFDEKKQATIIQSSQKLPQSAVAKNELLSSNFNSVTNNHDENAVMDSFLAKEKESNQDTTNKQPADNSLSLQTDLLSDNSLLNSLPNLRCSVDDLILDNAHLLDNSVSSNDAINVDEFVSERLKTITGSDIDLDLPSLDLFQFHS